VGVPVSVSSCCGSSWAAALCVAFSALLFPMLVLDTETALPGLLDMASTFLFYHPRSVFCVAATAVPPSFARLLFAIDILTISPVPNLALPMLKSSLQISHKCACCG
jgi:hypothetical protein